MTTGSVDDTALTAWLSTHLPALAAAADQHRWAHHLAAVLSDIRAGTPTTQAVANHHLPVDITTAADEQARISRGDSGIIDGPEHRPGDRHRPLCLPRRPAPRRMADGFARRWLWLPGRDERLTGSVEGRAGDGTRRAKARAR